MGVIGMKVYAAGVLLSDGTHRFTASEAMSYVLSLPGISTVVIGCSSPAEVDEKCADCPSVSTFRGTGDARA